MILETIDIVRNNMMPLNFLCHVMIFLGGFYVALHSRFLPTWTITCLWYIGLCSLLNCMTIFAQLFYGADFFLSYDNVGMITETLLNISVASTVAIYFSDTVIKDFLGMKRRTRKENLEI